MERIATYPDWIGKNPQKFAQTVLEQYTKKDVRRAIRLRNMGYPSEFLDMIQWLNIAKGE